MHSTRKSCAARYASEPESKSHRRIGNEIFIALHLYDSALGHAPRIIEEAPTDGVMSIRAGWSTLVFTRQRAWASVPRQRRSPPAHRHIGSVQSKAMQPRSCRRRTRRREPRERPGRYDRRCHRRRLPVDSAVDTRAASCAASSCEEETADQDARQPSTSEGLFVFSGSFPSLDVHEGERVCVTGPVSEFFGMTQITATAAGSLVLTAAAADLPAPATLVLPVVGNRNDYYEQHEGMRVAFAEPLYVSEYFEVPAMDRSCSPKAAGRSSTRTSMRHPLLAEYTQFLDTLGAVASSSTMSTTRRRAAPRRCVLPSAARRPRHRRAGVNFYRAATSSSISSACCIGRSPAGRDGRLARAPARSTPDVLRGNARPTRAPRSFGDIRVASFNVLNYFSTIDRPPARRLDRAVRPAHSTVVALTAPPVRAQNEKLIAALRAIDADVFGLVEIENNSAAVAELVHA